jgi:hypothetical protein
MSGIHGLVAVLILQLVRNIRRQGHLAQLVQDFLKNPLVIELNHTVSVIHGIHHGSCQQALAEFDDSPRLCLLAWAHQCLPYIILPALQQKYLYFCPCILLHPEKPGRYDLCIVNHQAVTRPQVLRNILKNSVLYLPCFPIQHHQPRGRTILQGVLGNQFFRQFIIKILYIHGQSYPPSLFYLHTGTACCAGTAFLLQNNRTVSCPGLFLGGMDHCPVP